VPPQRWIQSLQFRLLVATLVGLLLALVLAGFVLSGLFRDHVMRQFVATLTTQLDQVTTRLEFDAAGLPTLDAQALSDPRWSRPLSGLYWQIEEQTAAASPNRAPAAAEVMRSRSLWDNSLVVPPGGAEPSAVQVREISGPADAKLLLLERPVATPGSDALRWRVMVAGDLKDTALAVSQFDGVLVSSLVALMLLLALASAAQLVVGLAPLRALQRALAAVLEGRAQRLEGHFPAEVQPLAENFNGVLDRNAAVVARARTQAGNLAHAIKTPLAVMAQAAAQGLPSPASAASPPVQTTDSLAELPALVREQVAVANRQVDWHLTRARVAASQAVPGARVPVGPVINGLVRVMDRVHAARGLRLVYQPGLDEPAFAGETQDLQEMLGNLLDNACKWAKHEVRVQASCVPAAGARRLQISLEDDGPGIDEGQRQAVLARGARLDERVPGSGLGLAIVHELAALYGGELKLATSDTGGLRVELDLPLAP
jgi:signal transduction histidine kinase